MIIIAILVLTCCNFNFIYFFVYFSDVGAFLFQDSTIEISNFIGNSTLAKEEKQVYEHWVMNGGSDTEDGNGEKGMVYGFDNLGQQNGGSCITIGIRGSCLTRGIRGSCLTRGRGGTQPEE